jgi:pyrimidine-nucleoside phosphorylase
VEIRNIVLGYAEDRIDDTKMGQWLAHVYKNGMGFEETYEMTMAMVDSGEVVDLSLISGPTADKHSTGGVGDKTTLVIAPLAAACGLKIAKMSGRALGHTGGTLDKLESIPGFKTELSREDFISQVETVGAAIISQSSTMVPADKKIYRLRDATNTIASIPLIAASVMSKKIAAGAENIVLDVKCGEGAFMKTRLDAEELAETCLRLGQWAGRNVAALVTPMDAPLGQAVGTALEVREALDVLSGRGPSDVLALAFEIVGKMMILCGRANSLPQTEPILTEAINNGGALLKFGEIIRAQGGDMNIIHDYGLLPLPTHTRPVYAAENGLVGEMLTEQIGWLAKECSGFVFKKKTGDSVVVGETMALAYAQDDATADRAAELLSELIFIERSV